MVAEAIGWAVLAVLTGLAVTNAVGLALRAEPSGRAELGVAAAAAFFGLLIAPVFVLGYAGALTPTTVATSALLFELVVFALLVRGRTLRGDLCARGRALASLARLPADALVAAFRARSLVGVAMVYVCGLLLASIVFTVFVPNESWDGFLYHEPIVGFAIQNHGFAIIDLPRSQAVQATNGYPHAAEALALWFVIFTDKTLMELPNVLAAPALMLVAYALARRYGDAITAIGWACVLIFVPQAWAQLCQTYIDLEVAFFALVAIYFATRPTYRVHDAWWATLGAALLIGSKGTGLVMVPPILLLAYTRLVIVHWRGRRLAAIGSTAAGGAAVAAVGAVAPVRNWLAFHNPIWPVTYDNARFGIHWSGLQPLAEQVVDKPIRELLEIAHGIPTGGMDDVIARGYGYAFIWVVLPLGCAALVIAFAAAILERLHIVYRGRASNLALVLLLVVAGTLTAPTLAGQNARFNLHLVACLMAAVTWLLGGRRWVRARDGVLGAYIVLSIIPLYWMKGPLWYWVSTEHPEDVLTHPFRSRTALARPTFDLLARQRNVELKPDDWVVFDQDVGFVGALWNFEFSNRVKFVKYESMSAFLAAADAVQARWIAVGGDSDARKALEKMTRWEQVGTITRDGDAVFRRKASRLGK
jgi:4-amino-4-deoxy-L-arabinose transferase-like glycosyltransferase